MMERVIITDTIPLWVTSTVCVICAVIDLRCFRVPNWATLPLFVSGLAYHAAIGGWSGLSLGLVGAVFGFGILIVPYALGVMGAGDVKLLAGIGAWLGRSMTADVLLYAVLFGGLYAVAVVIMTGRLGWALARMRTILAQGKWQTDVPVDRVVDRSDPNGRLVPFAAMIAVGLLSISIYP